MRSVETGSGPVREPEDFSWKILKVRAHEIVKSRCNRRIDDATRRFLRECEARWLRSAARSTFTLPLNYTYEQIQRKNLALSITVCSTWAIARVFFPTRWLHRYREPMRNSYLNPPRVTSFIEKCRKKERERIPSLCP